MCGRSFAAWAVAMSAAVVQATAEPDWPDCDQVNESVSFASNSDVQAHSRSHSRPHAASRRRRCYNGSLRAQHAIRTQNIVEGDIGFADTMYAAN